MDLRIVPLGGLGEIGLNAMVVESAGRRLLIDCGLLFPRNRGLGVDVYVPELRYLLEQPGALDGVVITHGHEDHLGALPVLLRRLQVPVWGGRFALAMLRSRLAELGVEADLRPLEPGVRFGAGPFEVEPIHVNHSIPDAVGLAVRGEFGCVVHTGDFKIDPTPFDGRPTDLAAFGRAAGATCLLSDSTNAERAGTTASEKEVERTLLQLVQGARGRVVVTMFASHLVRMQQLVEIAARTDRKLVPVGRGMVENSRVGAELGHLRGAGAVVVDAEALDRLQEREVLITTTGAQGEPRAGLWRMAFDPNSAVRIRAGDTVVFCARAIPGNEVAVQELVNRLWELGAQVVTEENGEGPGRVHTSGHASRDEQAQMLAAVRPQTFVPIHGEARQLARHVRLAREHPAAPQVLLARDGDIIDFPTPGSAQVVGQAPVGRVALDKRGGSVVSEDTLRVRTLLAEGGVVTVLLLVERLTGAVLRGPELTGLGLTEAEGLLLRAREAVRDELAGLVEAARRDPERLREAAVRGVYRCFRREGERRPVVHALVVPV